MTSKFLSIMIMMQIHSARDGNSLNYLVKPLESCGCPCKFTSSKTTHIYVRAQRL